MDTDDPGEQRTPYLSRRMMLASATGLTPVAASLWGLRADADPGEVGRWSAPFDLGGAAIHATLLHTDDVLIFQYVEHRPTIDHTSWIATWNWRTRRTTRVPLRYDRDLFCAGHSVLPDGRLANRRVFATYVGRDKTIPATDQPVANPDGLAIDEEGRVYALTEAGIEVISPAGRHLGVIPTWCITRRCQNLTFGGADKKTLYVAGGGTLLRIPMIARGFAGRIK